MRLIDADALLEEAEYIFDERTEDLEPVVTNDQILGAPTVDVEPVVHARWEEYSKALGFLRCSHCKDCYVDKDWPKGSKWKYCPHCGARMELDNEDPD